MIVLDLPEERELYENVIKNLQDSMDDLFIEMTEIYMQAECQAPGDRWFAKHHARMIFLPGRAEIEMFENLYHLENFGIFEYTNFSSDTSFSLRDKVRNFVTLAKNPALLDSGVWPPVILNRMGLGWYQRMDGYKRYFGEFSGSCNVRKLLSLRK